MCHIVSSGHESEHRMSCGLGVGGGAVVSQSHLVSVQEGTDVLPSSHYHTRPLFSLMLWPSLGGVMAEVSDPCCLDLTQDYFQSYFLLNLFEI